MDRQKSTTKSRNKILNFLPRARSSVSFQNPPIYSPSKHIKPSEKPHKSHLGIGFSGPIVSNHTSRKIKNRLDDTGVYEPTSPKVSCMGQVKCKYTKQKPQLAGTNKPPTGKVSRLTSDTPQRTLDVDDGHVEASKPEGKSKKNIGFMKLFGKKKSKVALYLDEVESLSNKMNQVSSGRDELLDGDWTEEGVAAEYSGSRSYDFDEENDEEDVVVPSSAPVMLRNIPLGFDGKLVRVRGNMESKKEINLWKRRTMTQPKPLLLHNV